MANIFVMKCYRDNQTTAKKLLRVIYTPSIFHELWSTNG